MCEFSAIHSDHITLEQCITYQLCSVYHCDIIPIKPMVNYHHSDGTDVRMVSYWSRQSHKNYQYTD